MLQFIKKWHQAFQADKAERNMAANEVTQPFTELECSDGIKRFMQNVLESASEAIDESLEEEQKRRRRH